ncbi:hypothetical protein [Nocardia cyriacigeorgica]|uniref:hypothetical protein n=1 Tax=Nocardia cyriacigeorgica TaxID=135487 RepID=UPI0024578098|nr:hypothetical protein [Nocardia cyriacigeorgica]
MALWPDHDPQGMNGPDEMRGEAVLRAFGEEVKAGRKAFTAQEVFAILGGVIIDMEGRMVQMQRRLNELGESQPEAS